MIQSELFTPAALEYKEKGLRQLEALDFNSAWEGFTIAKKIDPYLADLDFLITLSEYARDHGAGPKTSAARLVTLWHEATQDLADGNLPMAAYRYLRELLARRLLQIGQFTQTGFCGEKEKILHRGVLHVVLNQWQEAHQVLLNLLAMAGEKASALHWGYLGDAAHALGSWKEANMAYVCALFIDPYEIDLLTLQHQRLREVLQSLTYETENENLARALWPIHAWLRDVIQIPRGNTFLRPLVRKLRSILGSELMLEMVQRIRQFSLCLYIDQSGMHEEIQFDVRAEMKTLEAELFARYLQEVERRLLAQ
ncbi:MAG: hypothetical protein ONB44_08080 [candidate division KSB1 bacterium]|nr:hypothetical protein [candidate division KSB1 bacterium]MDZ7302086.1 hypothetical protein [candidate division KSB1 bacterium]MDZ7311127.1 hypothetical protein [candidate division KSB1 bacterium]